MKMLNVVVAIVLITVTRPVLAQSADNLKKLAENEVAAAVEARAEAADKLQLAQEALAAARSRLAFVKKAQTDLEASLKTLEEATAPWNTTDQDLTDAKADDAPTAVIEPLEEREATLRRKVVEAEMKVFALIKKIAKHLKSDRFDATSRPAVVQAGLEKEMEALEGTSPSDIGAVEAATAALAAAQAAAEQAVREQTAALTLLLKVRETELAAAGNGKLGALLEALADKDAASTAAIEALTEALGKTDAKLGEIAAATDRNTAEVTKVAEATDKVASEIKTLGSKVEDNTAEVTKVAEATDKVAESVDGLRDEVKELRKAMETNAKTSVEAIVKALDELELKVEAGDVEVKLDCPDLSAVIELPDDLLKDVTDKLDRLAKAAENGLTGEKAKTLVTILERIAAEAEDCKQAKPETKTVTKTVTVREYYWTDRCGRHYKWNSDREVWMPANSIPKK